MKLRPRQKKTLGIVGIPRAGLRILSQPGTLGSVGNQIKKAPKSN